MDPPAGALLLAPGGPRTLRAPRGSTSCLPPGDDREPRARDAGYAPPRRMPGRSLGIAAHRCHQHVPGWDERTAPVGMTGGPVGCIGYLRNGTAISARPPVP